MFREMRKKSRALPREETIAILQQGSHGVLALSGDEGYPYAVPMSYVMLQNTLYFHGARVGHKIDALRQCDKASFCVVAQDTVIPEKFTTHFRSAIAFGRIRIVQDAVEMRRAIEALTEKYAPPIGARAQAEIAEAWNNLCILALTVEHLTGKASPASNT